MADKGKFYFENIVIEKFGRLNNINLHSAQKFNLIYSVGNFGKTTFLNALEAMLLPFSKCRIYNYFVTKYKEKAFYEFKDFLSFCDSSVISWRANEIDFFDMIFGRFKEDKFFGYANYQMENKRLRIKKFDGYDISFEKNQKLFPKDRTFTGSKYDFYDCRRDNRLQFSNPINSTVKDYILNFISMFSEDITDIFIKNGEIFAKNDKDKLIKAEKLGDFIYSSILFGRFLGSCKNKIVLIDNFDCMVNSVITEPFIEMFLGIVNKLKDKDIQFFITVSDINTVTSFSKILERNKRLSDLTVTALNKTAEGLMSENGI